MAPAADLDPKLLVLQGKVAHLRAEESRLRERVVTLERNRLLASAQALRLKADRTLAEFNAASRDLTAYINKRQRRSKT